MRSRAHYQGFILAVLDYPETVTIPEADLSLGGRLAMRHLFKTKHPKVDKVITWSRIKGKLISYIIRQ